MEEANYEVNHGQQVNLAIGLRLVLNDELFEKVRTSNATKHVDVMIEWGDQTKEFTAEEFKKLLGFTE